MTIVRETSHLTLPKTKKAPSVQGRFFKEKKERSTYGKRTVGEMSKSAKNRKKHKEKKWFQRAWGRAGPIINGKPRKGKRKKTQVRKGGIPERLRDTLPEPDRNQKMPVGQQGHHWEGEAFPEK